jgi:hypothetical protein
LPPITVRQIADPGRKEAADQGGQHTAESAVRWTDIVIAVFTIVLGLCESRVALSPITNGARLRRQTLGSRNPSTRQRPRRPNNRRTCKRPISRRSNLTISAEEI